jgi:hypothetical protein
MGEKSIAALVALLGLLAGSGPVVAQDDTGGAGERSGSPESSGYLLPPDPAVPAQESYRGWPGADLSDRFYGLPWSRMAFNRAELFGQPVLLVLTVDWNRSAQRLATEVLTDTRVLRVLNQGYITVVVNADLEPDIRERYQTGAWPVLAFLLPDGNPILSPANESGEPKPITTSERKSGPGS